MAGEGRREPFKPLRKSEINFSVCGPNTSRVSSRSQKGTLKPLKIYTDTYKCKCIRVNIQYYSSFFFIRLHVHPSRVNQRRMRKKKKLARFLFLFCSVSFFLFFSFPAFPSFFRYLLIPASAPVGSSLSKSRECDL